MLLRGAGVRLGSTFHPLQWLELAPEEPGWPEWWGYGEKGVISAHQSQWYLTIVSLELHTLPNLQENLAQFRGERLHSHG